MRVTSRMMSYQSKSDAHNTETIPIGMDKNGKETELLLV